MDGWMEGGLTIWQEQWIFQTNTFFFSKLMNTIQVDAASWPEFNHNLQGNWLFLLCRVPFHHWAWTITLELKIPTAQYLHKRLSIQFKFRRIYCSIIVCELTSLESRAAESAQRPQQNGQSEEGPYCYADDDSQPQRLWTNTQHILFSIFPFTLSHTHAHKHPRRNLFYYL